MSCQNTAAERQTAAQHVRRPGNSNDVSATQRPSSSEIPLNSASVVKSMRFSTAC